MPTPDAFVERPGFVFDTETTGVSAQLDRVVELGAVCLLGGQTSQERRMRINPEQPIPQGATAIHGIRDEDVVGKPTFSAIAERFAMYLDGRMHGGVTPWLAGYNAAGFDVPLLNAEFARVGCSICIDPAVVVDPMLFARWHLRHLRSRSLASICAHFGINVGRSHSALDDARATADLLFRLLAEGMMPPSVSEALRQQAELRLQLDAEWQDFSYWLYRDRNDGCLRLGAGSYIGTAVNDANPDYLRGLIGKVSDMPERVRAMLLAAATQRSTNVNAAL